MPAAIGHAAVIRGFGGDFLQHLAGFSVQRLCDIGDLFARPEALRGGLQGVGMAVGRFEQFDRAGPDEWKYGPLRLTLEREPARRAADSAS
jgi:hypothetical protein